MKIVFINNMLKNGGAEVSLCRIANQLNRIGYEISVITLAQESNYETLLDEGIHYYHIFSDSSKDNWVLHSIFRLSNYLKRFFVKILLTNKINHCRADIGITFNEFEKCLMPLVKSKTRKKICWFRHDITDYYLCERIIVEDRKKFEALFEKVDELLFVTNSSMNNFCSEFPSFKGKCNFFINSIDTDLICTLADSQIIQRADHTIVFLCLARLSKEKGQDLLFEAAELLDLAGYKGKYEIWLVGDYTDNDFDINPCHYDGDSIKQFGYIDNPYPYLKASDVLVSSSRSEGCPNVILEAMALGKPIISTKTSGGKELLENGRLGLLCDINATSLYDAMKMMFDSQTREYFKRISELEAQKHGNTFFVQSLIENFSQLFRSDN